MNTLPFIWLAETDIHSDHLQISQFTQPQIYHVMLIEAIQA
uniref:Uncharacterized protein n=1 Tax=Anguilla anguilla TaxID=7936 RepID=A0A0E9TK13_ANGAN